MAALAGCRGPGSPAARPRCNPATSPQFAAWVDAVVFVFSLEDEISFQTVYNYYLRLCSYRNTAEVPMVLVGTQGENGACLPPPQPRAGALVLRPAGLVSTGASSSVSLTWG